MGRVPEDLVKTQGTERAQYIMRALLQDAGAQGVGVPMVTTTDYINTVPVDQEPDYPGDEEIERRYRAYMRWNAAMMVQRAQKPEIGVGGHISSFAGVATLYEVGQNHFFRGPDHPGGGDQIFWQGHSSPATTPAPTSRAVSARRTWTASARRRPRRAMRCPPTRTRA